MKYRTQHDLLDPDKPAPNFDFDGDDGSETPGDAYVIGENGKSLDAAEPPSASASAPVSWAHRYRWSKPAAFGLIALCVVMTFWNVSRVVQGPPPPPRITPFQTKQALYLGVMKIDAFRRVEGSLPETLDEVGVPADGGYTYNRVDATHYVLAFQGNGPKLEYDSSQPKERYFGTPKEMLTMGGSQ